ncbi:hypothetical protein P4K54_23625 [Bacillus cereus]|uniref:hypothetical protein n=1 Tax=Bacillus cereus TaxID=1396 RepID=UPI000BF432EC|nr:hypothetical protein [Bacillus cereus]MEB9822060.1 hypothetical protein [Bacillus cereus]MEB9828503.1 hypothetical protein [Bacillus cereus]PES03481.1 hypothetical protein CN480_19365 [Bacillus cereus]
MARSTESMPRAVYVSENEIRSIDPQEAILLRQLSGNSGYTLYCEHYLKCDCTAKVKVVDRTGNQAFHLKSNESHCADCSYLLDTIPIKERVKKIPKNQKLILQIDESDMFQGSEKTTNSEGEKKKFTIDSRVLKVPEKITTKVVDGTKNTYIRTVSDLIELLNCEDDVKIKYALKQLYDTNMLYKSSNYKEIWKQEPKHTFIVEGYLDQGGLKLLNKNGYAYAFQNYKWEKDEIRIMLVHKGKGTKRFQQTLKGLLEWIEKEVEGNRKLALIKGNILGFYKEKKIIVLHVKDIDIKYRKYEYKLDKHPLQHKMKKEFNLPTVRKEIKKESLQKRPLKIESTKIEERFTKPKQDIDVYTDEFLLQFITQEQLQKIKQTNVPSVPLDMWFTNKNEEKYNLVPMSRFMGVKNSRGRQGTWLNQLYELDGARRNLEEIKNNGIEQFKRVVRKESDIFFCYYEDLDAYYVCDGGTHRSVIAKILNIDYIMAQIRVYKSNGNLEKEQRKFSEQLNRLENIIKDIGFVPVYDKYKKTISIFSTDDQPITVLKDVVYPTFYQSGKNHFKHWLSVFQELKEEGMRLKKKPYFFRKCILFYKKRKDGLFHEEYYFKMLQDYTLQK